ncbi:MAG: TatD family hydrolase [Candidatus Kapaibacterium sp.]
MPSLIDTHSHIYVDRFADDIEQVIERAREAGVETIVVPTTKPSEFAPALALADRFPEVKVAIGVHPHHAHEINGDDLLEIERLGTVGKAIAIGEIGLDYYYEFAPKERQHEIFRDQLRIAKRTGLPAVVHNRESDDDLMRIIEEEQDGLLRFQLHCFSSSEEVLRRAMDLGGMVSFTGNITYKNSALDGVVRSVPADRFMIETDAPYLTPVPYRGKRNEPGHVSLVAAKIAEIRGETIETITLMTTANAQRFFRLALLFIALLGAAGVRAIAQPASPAPVREIDTTAKQDPPFHKLFGIGAHFASSSYIRGASTDATATGFGVWGTVAPLQPLGVNWLQIDLIYTAVTVAGNQYDSSFIATVAHNPQDAGMQVPPNHHNTFDISARFTANPRKTITLYGSLGLTYFHNDFGIDGYLISRNEFDQKKYVTSVENNWGPSVAIGVTLNLDTPLGTVAPTAEWRYGTILGERTLPQRKQEFSVSQPRVGILIYPDFNKIF